MRVGGRGERREKQEREDGGIFAGLGHFGDHPTPEGKERVGSGSWRRRVMHSNEPRIRSYDDDGSLAGGEKKPGLT